MKKYGRFAGAVVVGVLLAAGTVYAVPKEYEDVVNALKQDNKKVETTLVKEDGKTLTEYVELKDKVYISVKETVIRSLPEDTSKGVKKAAFGKWLNRIGVCENGWSVVTYRDQDKKKCIGYIETKELSDQVPIEEVSDQAVASEDVDILDFPSLKEGKTVGEYIQGDEVQRIGVCNEVWSQVSFENEEGKTIKGFVPTQSLEGLEEADKEEQASEEMETGMISPGSGSGIFVDASNKVTAGGTIEDGVIIGDAVAVPEGAKLIPLGTFRITHYCPCSLCCGPWADGITSTGVTAKTNHTIAVDPSQIPYGSKVVINGQVYVAEDCGGAIVENCIDVYVASHEEGEAKGVYYTDVYLLEE